MTNARRDGLYLVLLGCAVFVLIGSALENAVPVTAVDFRVVYYSARCLLEHRDPYNESDLDYIYRAKVGKRRRTVTKFAEARGSITIYQLLFHLLFHSRFFPFGPAHFLWLAFTACSVILASYPYVGYRGAIRANSCWSLGLFSPCQ